MDIIAHDCSRDIFILMITLRSLWTQVTGGVMNEEILELMTTCVEVSELEVTLITPDIYIHSYDSP